MDEEGNIQSPFGVNEGWKTTDFSVWSQVVPGAAEPGEGEAGRGADREGWRVQRTTGCTTEQHADTNTSGW